MNLPNHIRTCIFAYRKKILKYAIKQCYQIGLDEWDKIVLFFIGLIMAIFFVVSHVNEIDGKLTQTHAKLKQTRQTALNYERFIVTCLNHGYVTVSGHTRPCDVSEERLRK